ncbi:DNA modification methylase [Pelagimonas sp. KU-00592-HH]|uniref:site-specific DNA-methyltransferase n=1 Tax=Pelagimonas sp. KU-00592-HH TaxID=3127651 RepID=UPI00310B3576
MENPNSKIRTTGDGEMPARDVRYLSVGELRPYSGNARTHSAKQISQIAASIRTFGFVNPVLVTEEGVIIAGHGRVEAAKQLGMSRVPTLEISSLSPDELRAYVIADNRIAECADWDKDILAIEFQALASAELEFELEVSGFETAEIDLLLQPLEADEACDDECPPAVPKGDPVTRVGDIWLLGKHRLVCGDARLAATYGDLMKSEKAQVVFTDPPYNVKIDGHVCGGGKIQHKEFAMASGEMNSDEFKHFLISSLRNMARVSSDGAIHFVCMDWRHLPELLFAGAEVYSELKNLVVWKKTNAGMGSFYRSQHELVFVYKNGRAPHRNNFGLGERGRYRTNVWEYPGVNSFGRNQADLELHPTVKPVAMIADALRDVSRRGEVVLDGFGGAGSTLLAAERTGRRARLVELEPAYCDVTCLRFEKLTGQTPTLEASGQTFHEVSRTRCSLVETGMEASQ